MQCKKKNQLSNVTKKGETIVALIVLMAPFLSSALYGDNFLSSPNTHL